MRTTVCWSSGVGLRMWNSWFTPPVCFRKSVNMRSVSARTKLSRVTTVPVAVDETAAAAGAVGAAFCAVGSLG